MKRRKYYKSEEDRNLTAGTSFSGILVVTFIALKLAKIINWSWWWVLAPLWIPVAFFVVLILVVVIANRIIKNIN